MATRPSTDAAATAARTGASSDHGSEASPSFGAAREPAPRGGPLDPPRDESDHFRHILARSRGPG
jgi:hypothetical protein